MSNSSLLQQRADLLARDLLLAAGVTSLSTSSSADVGFDYLAVLEQHDRGGPFYFVVEVKATELLASPRFRFKRSLIQRMRQSNMPSLLLVVDAKSNQAFFRWASEIDDSELGEGATVTIPLHPIRREDAPSLFSRVLIPSAVAS